MKRNSLILSILTIVLCATLIAGSSFALFTSESKVNVAVTAGTVKVTATAGEVSYESTLGEKLPESDATVAGNIVTIEKMVPGDVIKFDITIHNESDVTVKYRTVISVVEDNDLAAGLTITVGEEDFDVSKIARTKWMVLAPESDDITVPVEITLPVEAGNEYQGKSCKLAYTVEAVQGNAQPDVIEVGTFAELKAALANTSEAWTVKLKNDIELEGALTVPAGANIKLDMNGKKLVIPDGADLNAFVPDTDTPPTVFDIKRNGSIVIDGNGTVDRGANGMIPMFVPRGDVTIQNGIFTVDAGLNSYNPTFIGISNGIGKLVINGGYFDGGYYVEGDCANNCSKLLNASWGQYVRIYGGTFVAQNPAWGDEGRADLCPHCSGQTYCQALFLEGQTNRTATEIPSAYTITEGTTTDGRPTYTVSYNP